MKKFYLLPVLALSAFAVDAKNLAVNGQEYEVDTLVTPHHVGPGTMYAHYRVPKRPMEIHVLQFDLSNPYITMEVWNGGSAAVACETPTSVYGRYEKDGIQVVAAHNGDFFTTNLGESGISRMGLIGAGDVIFNPTGNPLFVVDGNGQPWIDYVQFGGQLKAGEKTSRIHTVNQLRLEWEPATHADQLSLYTPAFGSKMHANSAGGTVAVVKPVSGNVAFPTNKPIEMKVIERLANPGQIEIPADGAVLHGVGSSATVLDALQPGETVTVSLNASLPSYPDVKNLREGMGGSGHIILRNGQITNINNPDCHPRTFMGISQDRKTVWSVIVDGRWASSAGIDLDDEGRVLQWL
ncbi:MAG: phosphodiester glycosidase family protein [Muribaculaceae bacterium]|nr:phosphodiester glycosidase family protein [Muribaculaceae bacterium]